MRTAKNNKHTHTHTQVCLAEGHPAYMSTPRPEGRKTLFALWVTVWEVGCWFVVGCRRRRRSYINTNIHTSVKYVMQKRPTSSSTHNLKMASGLQIAAGEARLVVPEGYIRSSVRGEFWAQSVKILVFTSPTDYMMWSFGLSLPVWGVLRRFALEWWVIFLKLELRPVIYQIQPVHLYRFL